MDTLLGSNKVCLDHENSKTDLTFMRLEKYSSCIRLISVTTLVLHFIKSLKRKFDKDVLYLRPLVISGEKKLKLRICELDSLPVILLIMITINNYKENLIYVLKIYLSLRETQKESIELFFKIFTFIVVKKLFHRFSNKSL